jgi:hypothetical protein
VEFNVSLNVDGKTVKVCKVKQLEIKQIEHKVTEKAKNNY